MRKILLSLWCSPDPTRQAMSGVFVAGLLLSSLTLQGFAGKKGVMLTFEAFHPSGIEEVGLVFLPARGKSSGDPLARSVCMASGKALSLCARAHTVRVMRFPLPPVELKDVVP